MLFVSIKIVVVVQKIVFILDAECSDEAVYSLANRYPFAAQQTEVARALQGETGVDHLYLGEFAERPASFLKINILAKALQHFRQDQIANQDRPLIHHLMKIICLKVLDPVEVIDPHR